MRVWARTSGRIFSIWSFPWEEKTPWTKQKWIRPFKFRCCKINRFFPTVLPSHSLFHFQNFFSNIPLNAIISVFMWQLNEIFAQILIIYAFKMKSISFYFHSCDCDRLLSYLFLFSHCASVSSLCLFYCYYYFCFLHSNNSFFSSFCCFFYCALGQKKERQKKCGRANTRVRESERIFMLTEFMRIQKWFVCSWKRWSDN